MRGQHWLLLPLTSILAAGLGYGVLSLPEQSPGLQAAVAFRLESSGVSNPVTAVLLNFRGYDTLLEMVVLLLAILGIRSLGADFAVARHPAPPGPVLDILTRLLVPILVLVAIYLLWVGAHAPGGAFQAGAILGAAGVLWILSCGRLRLDLDHPPLRYALVAGVVAFIAIAVLTLLSGREMLEYPPAQAGNLIFFIELVAAVSIGVTLTMLFLGTEPTDGRSP